MPLKWKPKLSLILELRKWKWMIITKLKTLKEEDDEEDEDA